MGREGREERVCSATYDKQQGEKERRFLFLSSTHMNEQIQRINELGVIFRSLSFPSELSFSARRGRARRRSPRGLIWLKMAQRPGFGCGCSLLFPSILLLFSSPATALSCLVWCLGGLKLEGITALFTTIPWHVQQHQLLSFLNLPTHTLPDLTSKL